MPASETDSSWYPKSIIICFVCVVLTKLTKLGAVRPQLTFDYDPDNSGPTKGGEGVTAVFGRAVAQGTVHQRQYQNH